MPMCLKYFKNNFEYFDICDWKNPENRTEYSLSACNFELEKKNKNLEIIQAMDLLLLLLILSGN